MDRNQFLGLILMLVLITVYFNFFVETPEPPQPEIDNAVSEAIISETDTDSSANRSNVPETLSDSAKTKLQEMKYGLFSVAAEGLGKNINLENDKLKVTISSKGALIQSVVLKEYTSYDGGPLELVGKGHDLNIYFEHLTRKINIADLYFSSNVKQYEDSVSAIFKLTVDGKSISSIYTLKNGEYTLGHRLVDDGFSKLIDPKDLSFYWSANLPKLETDLKDARNRTSVIYYTAAGEDNDLSRTSQDHEEETINEPTKWVAFNQKFFTSAFIAGDKSSFSNAFLTQDVPQDSSIVKLTTMQLSIPYTNLANQQTEFKYYFGPNSYYDLKDVAEGFSENINLGWFFLPLINKYLVIPIFHFLEKFIGNYGVIIIIMVLIIRLLLSPLTYKSHISMAKMRVIKPEIDEIKEKTGDDMQKFQTEQMALYRKVGINPLSGCIPVLLQFPILVSLFYFIPSAIEFRQESFLWADDLSTYDSILNLPFSIPFYGDHISLFTLLMAGSTILSTLANSQMTTVQGPMKTVQYVMPVMLLFFFNSYPSGLSYYYFISNLVSYGQIALFRKFINEDKIKAILEENKKKNANKKKSKFQQRLEDAMKASQEAQKNKKKKK